MSAHFRLMRVAAFTIDVDRDVNLPVTGKKQAISKCHDGDREEVRFDSSLRGLRLILETLQEMRIKATFFMEGDTLLHIQRSTNVRELLSKHEVACHGVCHEDITGESTGVALDDAELSQMIDDSREMLRKAFGYEPLGFRAPYQHIDQRTLDMLGRKGFLYDSSMIKVLDGERSIHPWKVSEGMLEMPLMQAKDMRGKTIVSYLWPMHEGRRAPEDYVNMAAGMRSGALVLATHSWHVTETYGRGLLTESSIGFNLANLRQVLEGFKLEGLEFHCLADLARIWKE